ncbi:MAG: hypothetical protein WC515_00260 [Candidatus Omnitrophota bacterium]
MKDTVSLPGNIAKVTGDFVGRLKDIYGEDLVSAVLYGSASRGEFSKGASNVNIAVVLRDTGPDNLAKMRALTGSFRFRTFRPVLFTESYLARSLDVFPIEFLDIKENGIVLYGKDVFGSCDIDTTNLRFQCEHELKALLIRARRIYMTYRDAGALKKALFGLTTSALHISRNLLRTKGYLPGAGRAGVLDGISCRFNVDTGPFSAMFDARDGVVRIRAGEVDALFRRFLSSLESLTEAADRS